MNQDAHRLAKALRDYGTGHMPNLWPHLSSIAFLLFLVGEKIKKFVQIGQQLENHLQDSHKVQISNVGHTIHVEDSTEFDTIILDFKGGAK